MPALLAAVLLVLALPCGAQSGVELAALDARIAQARSDWGVPGMAVAIVAGDRVVLARGYGVRELGKHEPVDEHTLFAIASNTKAFTAAALATLVEEGKLAWDDRVQDHLPTFQLHDPWISRDIRVEDLLCHRSGLGTFSGDLVWWGTAYSRDEIVRRARFLPPAVPFRSAYRYNNVMFIAAGQVAAATGGASWDELIQRRILDPLAMNRTATSVSKALEFGNMATPHGPTYGPPKPFPWVPWDSSAAAGGIISSAADMARWLRLQLGRGSADGVTVFGLQSSRKMWTPHVAIPVGQESETRFPSTHFRGYGLGWGLSDYRGRRIVAHGGGYDGMYSRVVLVPEEQIALVVLTNSMTSLPAAVAYTILDAYLGGNDRDWSRELLEEHRDKEVVHAEEQTSRETRRIADTRPSHPTEAYAGTFRSDLYGDAQVRVEDGALVLRLLPNPDLVADLTHWHLDTFRLAWRKEFTWFGGGWAQFVLDVNGAITELKLDVPNEDMWFNEPEFLRLP